MAQVSSPKLAAFNECYGRLNLVVGAANSIAGGWLADTVEQMQKDARLFRHQVKHEARECLRMFNDYERAHLTNHCGMKAFYIDYLDMMDDRTRPHTEKMYWAVKNRLDKASVTGSAMKARVEMTLTLLDYSVYLYRSLISDVRAQTGYDFDPVLRKACLAPLLRRWETVERLVCKTRKGVRIDLNDDPACMLGFRCIENVLTSEDTLNSAALQALRLNRDVAEQHGVSLEEELS